MTFPKLVSKLFVNLKNLEFLITNYGLILWYLLKLNLKSYISSTLQLHYNGSFFGFFFFFFGISNK